MFEALSPLLQRAYAAQRSCSDDVLNAVMRRKVGYLDMVYDRCDEHR